MGEGAYVIIRYIYLTVYIKSKPPTMPIPKVIYQTWKTKTLHPNCIKIRDNIQRMNPEYRMELHDDDDMATFIQANFPEHVYNCYAQLNVGAAKADFWRYCVLYIYGGVYLDMDSVILRPLSELIRGDEQCIITREGNKGIFNNWIMMFEHGHPILRQTIQNCCHNIEHKTSKDICYLTGPAGPFTLAINQTMVPYYNRDTHLYFESDADLNNVLDNPANSVRCRFYGVDMDSFAKWKHEFHEDLYRNHVYWRNEKRIFNESPTSL